MSLVTGLSIFSSAMGLAGGLKGNNKANDLDSRSIALREETLQMAKEEQARWGRLYGPLEENLSEFYQKLTPDYIKAQGLQAYEKQFADTQRQLRETFAQNGIESGVQQDLLTKTELQGARDKAQISADAELKSAEQQKSFLSLGLTQKPGITADVINANSGLATQLGNSAGIAANNAAAGFGAAGDALSTLATELDRDKPAPTANTGDTIN
jgi:hypothetical protein